MDRLEKMVLRTNHKALLQDLDIRDITPVLYQNYMIDEAQYEILCKRDMPRVKLCDLLLRMITFSGSKCTFKGLLTAFRHENVYGFLADKLEQSLAEIRTSGNAETIDETFPAEGNTEYDREIIFEPVRKINVFTASRRKLVRLAHELKRFIHNGDIEQYCMLTQLINRRFQTHAFNLDESFIHKMELADMRFTALEADVIARRVKYDATLYGSDVFEEMLEVLPLTSNPRVTSMTYLARYGSSISMCEGIDPGLAYLQYAKHHAEHVTPCMDTGMVYYIEVNLLSQKYEASPSEDLKVKVLQTAQLAISQFGAESEDIRNDYQRMLMLKMVFCYLGIGLFVNRIRNVETTTKDLDAAKQCLDFIEKPAIWNGMEKRRKMLFHVAKTEYYRHIGTYELAKIHAKESSKIARQNGWTAELPNIESITKELNEHKLETTSIKIEDGFLQDLMNELTDVPSIDVTDRRTFQTMECDDAGASYS